ncbi:MAG: DUF3106 domain-containing protein [Planctomycetota bacterium]
MRNVFKSMRVARFIGVAHTLVLFVSLGVATGVEAQETAPTRSSQEAPNTPEQEAAVSPPPENLSSLTEEPRPPAAEPERRMRRPASPGGRSDERKLDRTPEENERWKRNRERWRQMNPDERAGMRRLHRLLRDLPEERRKQLVERFRQLNPDDRRALLERLEKFRTRAPDEQVRYEQRHQALRGFLRELPDEERERILALDPEARARELRTIVERMMRRFYNSLPPEEQQRLDALSAADREAELRRRFLESRPRRKPPAAGDAPENGREPQGAGDRSRHPPHGGRGARNGDRPGEFGPPPPDGREGPPPSGAPSGSRLRAELEQLGRLRVQLEELPLELRQELLADPTSANAHPKLTPELRDSVTKLTRHQRGRLLHLWRPRDRRGPPSDRPDKLPGEAGRPGEPRKPSPTAAQGDSNSPGRSDLGAQVW